MCVCVRPVVRGWPPGALGAAVALWVMLVKLARQILMNTVSYEVRDRFLKHVPEPRLSGEGLGGGETEVWGGGLDEPRCRHPMWASGGGD